jgi:hypothetical protein
MQGEATNSKDHVIVIFSNGMEILEIQLVKILSELYPVSEP